jgi:hypothetical protein
MSSRRSLGFALRLATWSSVVLAIAACAPSYHDRYLEAHPGWRSGGPRAGLGLDELLASITAPRSDPPYGVAHVKAVRIFDFGADPPADLTSAFEAGTGTVPARALVGVQVACTATVPNYWYIAEATFWYVLEDDRVVAYLQARYEEPVCRTSAIDGLAVRKLSAERLAWLTKQLKGGAPD